MVYHKIKKIKGRPYNYLIESFKFRGKVHQIQKYLGPKRMKKAEIEEAKVKHRNWFRSEIIKKKASLSASGYKSTILSSKQLNQLETIRYAFREFKKGLHPNEIERLERDFDIGYVYSTTSTEGNTCTLSEVTRILENHLTPKGRSLREIYEIRNFEEILRYRKESKGDISKKFILKLHELVMRDIDLYTLGTFRRIEVAILGSETTPVPAIFAEEEIDKLLKWYHKSKGKIHPVEQATEFHARFEAIHPFTDGNGRVGREIFNFMITRSGFPVLNFNVKLRDEYLDGLEMAQKGDFGLIMRYILENYIQQMQTRLKNTPLKDLFDVTD
ncbi:MAG: Fic family protein [Methanomassiliicoccales archaeon]|nr:MAG: Fic family protein [Methanomassiliicoccales archaeon]